MNNHISIEAGLLTETLTEYLGFYDVPFEIKNSEIQIDLNADEHTKSYAFSAIALTAVQEVYHQAAKRIIKNESDEYVYKVGIGTMVVVMPTSEHHYFAKSRISLFFASENKLALEAYVKFSMQSLSNEVSEIIETFEKKDSAFSLFNEGDWYLNVFSFYEKCPLAGFLHPDFENEIKQRMVNFFEKNEEQLDESEILDIGKVFIASYRNAVGHHRLIKFEEIDISENKSGLLSITSNGANLVNLNSVFTDDIDKVNTTIVAFFSGLLVVAIPKKITMHNSLSIKNRGWLLNILKLNHYANEVLVNCKDKNCSFCEEHE